MIPYHPIVASFPIVLLVLVFLTEIIAYFGDVRAWRLFSCFTLIICSISVGVSYYSGFYDLELAMKIDKISPEAIANHQTSAKIFLMSIIPTLLFSILRSIKPMELLHWLYTPCLILSIILAGITSHRGGELVFNHAAGVNKSATNDHLTEIK